MFKIRSFIQSAFKFAAFAWLLVSCRAPATADVPLTFQPTDPATDTPFVPTPLPPGPKSLIVCLADEPESLFIYHPDVLYGEASSEANTVLQAIYDGPVDLIGYQVEPVILEDLPTLENGDVFLQPITLAENEVFYNPVTLQPENLRVGDRYLPQDCNSPDCIAIYSGGEVQMDQLVVEFRLREGIRWSDGQPLTALDSQFSFKLDQRGEMPTTKFLVDRTADYRVMDEGTVRWVGIPGYMDSDFQTNFWPPLPEHILGDIPAGELLSAESSSRSPIGWGAYMIESWESGEITLVPNPNYFRNNRNLPAFDQLFFRFLQERGDGALQQILTDECDIIDESLLVPGDYQRAQSLRDDGRAEVWSVSDAQIIRLDFNLEPIGSNRPAYFQDQRTRQAVAQCVDRSQIQSMFGSESGTVPQTYINVDHPTASAEVEPVSFDPEAGRALLDQIGWVLDEDNLESPRVAFGVPGMPRATPFNVSLLTSETDEMNAIAELIESDLEECGLAVEISSVPEVELGAPWPDGEAFGRHHDFVLWSWPEWVSPLCEMFAGWEIPSSSQPFGINASGYQSDAYDTACKKALLSIPGMEGYADVLVETQEIFNQDLPGMPLLQPRRWIVSDTETCGLALDGLASSSLWNLEMLDSGESCP